MENKFDNKPYKSLVITVAAILLFSFIIIMVNQVAQLINLAMSINPLFGKILFWFFTLLSTISVFFIILHISSLNKPLVIPNENNLEEYSNYLIKLRKRLMKNKYLIKNNYIWEPDESDIDSINRALSILDIESKNIIKAQATSVFITTVISQNGSLDSVFVFVSAMKLVWRLSIHYNQRPAISDLVKLYSNVFGTVLLSRQIDDLDLVAEQLEPVISSLLGGTVGTIVPGISYVVSFVVDSVLEGSINTLLTLRVGLITQKYCRSITKIEPRTIGKASTIVACEILGNIITDNSKKIADSLFKAIRNATMHSFDKGKHKFTGILERMFMNGYGV